MWLCLLRVASATPLLFDQPLGNVTNSRILNTSCTSNQFKLLLCLAFNQSLSRFNYNVVALYVMFRSFDSVSDRSTPNVMCHVIYHSDPLLHYRLYQSSSTPRILAYSVTEERVIQVAAGSAPLPAYLIQLVSWWHPRYDRSVNAVPSQNLNDWMSDVCFDTITCQSCSFSEKEWLSSYSIFASSSRLCWRSHMGKSLCTSY